MRMLARELVSRMPLGVELKDKPKEDLLLVDSLVLLLKPNLLTKVLQLMLLKKCSSTT